MWILSFLPDSWLYLAVISVLTVGVSLYALSFFTKFVPPLIPYSGIVRIIGTLLVVAGIYFYGGYSTEMSWRNKVAELEEKVKASEVKAKEANTKIETVYKDRIKVVKETQVVIQERIKEVEKRIDSQCVVDSEVINILNEAAKKVKK
jgi:hypothetical protein